MHIHDFADLLSAAQAQPEPQRLLLVFTCAELPDDASEAEREAFAQGHGGSLKPVLCVDKLPDELADFPSLCAEAERTGQAWDLLFAAGLSGRAGQAPSSDEAEQPLRMMVGAIEAGSVGSFLAFDRSGQPLMLT
jgi:hypothetical protein